MSPVQGKSYMIYVSPEGLSIIEKGTFMEYVYITKDIPFKIKQIMKREKTVSDFKGYLWMTAKH